MSAAGDAFRKHPIALSLIGVFAGVLITDNIADAFKDDVFPQKLECEFREAALHNSRLEISIELGLRNEDVPATLNAPDEVLQQVRGAKLVCEASQ